MEIQCGHCGIALPRDDARFCNNCGTPVPAPSAQHQSVSGAENLAVSPVFVSSQAPHAEDKPVLREQVAHLPPSLPVSHSAHNRSPADGDKSDTTPANEISPGKRQEQLQVPPDSERKGFLTQATEAKKNQQGKSESIQSPPLSFKWPAPITHVSGSASSEQKEEGVASEQEDFPDAGLPKQLPNSIDAQKNVWERDGALPFTPPQQPSHNEETAIEDLPTRQLETSFTSLSTWGATPAHTSPPVPVEMLDTVPVLPQQSKPGNPVTPVPQTPRLPEESLSGLPHEYRGQGDHGPGVRHEHVRQQSTSGMQGQNTNAPSSQGHAHAIGGATSFPLARFTRKPLVAAVVALVIILGGLGAWIAVAKPFSVSPVTQPWQSFADKSLGFSLLYPNNDWGVKIDRPKSTVQFSDSSRTAQVNVVVTNASTSDLPQYLSQQAKHLGLSGTKVGAPMTFAGATWQQIQGSTQQSGANYRGTILATVHNNRLYTITQLAPLSNYADHETVIFSSMRKSWRFV